MTGFAWILMISSKIIAAHPKLNRCCNSRSIWESIIEKIAFESGDHKLKGIFYRVYPRERETRLDHPWSTVNTNVDFPRRTDYLMHDHLVHFDKILRLVTHVITQTVPQDHETNCTNNNAYITRARRWREKERHGLYKIFKLPFSSSTSLISR